MTQTPTLLRDRNAPGHARVGFVELFYDLVFVFAVTRLSHLLIEHPTVEGALQTGFLLLAVWTVWMWTTWATNWLDARHSAVRLMLFAMMAAGLVMSAAIPDAFGDRALFFALAYAFMQNFKNAFLVWALRKGAPNEQRNFIRLQFWLLVGAALWIAGAFAEGPMRWALWGAALFAEMGSPWWRFYAPGLGASTTRDWTVDPEHMAERCGLFVILALGESIILLGATFADHPWTPLYAFAFLIGLAGSATMWWIYFKTAAERADEAFAHHEDAGRVARAAYTYAHIPIAAGIIVAAVAGEMLLAHPTGHASASALAAMIGGPALFLAGNFAFARLACGEWLASHLAGLAALAPVWLFGARAEPFAAGAAAVAVLVAVALFETLRRGRAAPAGAAGAD